MLCSHTRLFKFSCAQNKSTTITNTSAKSRRIVQQPCSFFFFGSNCASHRLYKKIFPSCFVHVLVKKLYAAAFFTPFFIVLCATNCLYLVKMLLLLHFVATMMIMMEVLCSWWWWDDTNKNIYNKIFCCLYIGWELLAAIGVAFYSALHFFKMWENFFVYFYG